MEFDLKLSVEERRRRRNEEGFGDNQYGTNEISIPPATINRVPVNNYPLFDEVDNLNEVVYPGEVNALQEFDLPHPIYDKFIKLDNWQYVKDGKITSFASLEDLTDKKNRRSFKIPLMLKTMGHGIQRDNFKYVPMKVFGPIFIKIYLNRYAFFVPHRIAKVHHLNQLYNKMEEGLDQIVSRNFELKNVVLQYEIIEYSPHIKAELMNQVNNNGWIIDYKGLVLSNQFYLQSFPTIDGLCTFKDKNQIRAIYIALTTDLYKYSPYSRRLARHNRGFKKIEFRYRNEILPNVIYEHNSLNTHGEKNAAYFYDQYMKSTDNIPGTVISFKNFCLNNSLSESIALYHYSTLKGNPIFRFDELVEFTDEPSFNEYRVDSKIRYAFNVRFMKYFTRSIKDYDSFDGNIEEHACKTLFCVNFDNMPYSADAYRNGLQVEKESDTFKLTFHRVDHFLQYDPFAQFRDIYTYMDIYLEYYETAVLNSQGQFSYS